MAQKTKPLRDQHCLAPLLIHLLANSSGQIPEDDANPENNPKAAPPLDTGDKAGVSCSLTLPVQFELLQLFGNGWTPRMDSVSALPRSPAPPPFK